MSVTNAQHKWNRLVTASSDVNNCWKAENIYVLLERMTYRPCPLEIMSGLLGPGPANILPFGLWALKIAMTIGPGGANFGLGYFIWNWSQWRIRHTLSTKKSSLMFVEPTYYFRQKAPDATRGRSAIEVPKEPQTKNTPLEQKLYIRRQNSLRQNIWRQNIERQNI